MELTIKEKVEEVHSKISEKNLPVFYKYRYTFGKDEQDVTTQISLAKLMISWIKSHYLLGELIVAGIEHYTKGMLPAKPHLHIHFMSRHSGDSIRKGLTYEFDFKGKCQSCKAEVLVDESKFWRYPLKQQSGLSKVFHNVSGWTPDEITCNIEIAYACWIQSAEIYVGKLEKKLERTTKDRLYSHLDNLNFVFKSIKQVCCIAYQYYAEYEDNLCVKTVDAYVNIYLLQKGFLNAEQLYDLTHN